jgi:hypothetical protein
MNSSGDTRIQREKRGETIAILKTILGDTDD